MQYDILWIEGADRIGLLKNQTGRIVNGRMESSGIYGWKRLPSSSIAR
jgi:hypothetical protein